MRQVLAYNMEAGDSVNDGINTTPGLEMMTESTTTTTFFCIVWSFRRREIVTRVDPNKRCNPLQIVLAQDPIVVASLLSSSETTALFSQTVRLYTKQGISVWCLGNKL